MTPTPRLLLVGLSVLAIGAPAPAQAATRACPTLKGTKVLTTPKLRVVSVPFDTTYRRSGTRVVGRNLLACARPRGTVRKIGTTFNEYATTGSIKGQSAVGSGFTSLGTTTGTFIVTRLREADLAGNFAETYRVVDVATGRRYSYFHELQTEEGSLSEPAPPVTVRLDATGRLAAVLSSRKDEGYSAPPVGRTQVVAFTSTGARTVLDEAPLADIPSASLKLADGVVGWINAGQAKSAPAP